MIGACFQESTRRFYPEKIFLCHHRTTGFLAFNCAGTIPTNNHIFYCLYFNKLRVWFSWPDNSIQDGRKSLAVFRVLVLSDADLLSRYNFVPNAPNKTCFGIVPTDVNFSLKLSVFLYTHFRSLHVLPNWRWINTWCAVPIIAILTHTR